ncbi:MAG: hypothetical protein ACLF0G_10795 [Candidatus Brocadiia bacterium]
MAQSSRTARTAGGHGARRAASAAALALLAAVVAGCGPRRGAAPPLALSASLDREQYAVGEPLVVALRLENRGRRAVELPQFTHQAVKFLYGCTERGAPRIIRQPVHSRQVAPQPRHLEPGESLRRRFLFTRLTDEPGEYALLAGFKGAVVGGTWTDQRVYAQPVAYRVGEQVALRRDPTSGMLLKAQAVELARREGEGEVANARGVLVPLGETGLYTWVVLLEVRGEDGERRRVVQVNPYSGRVEPLPLKNGKPRLEPVAEPHRTAVPTSREADGRPEQPLSRNTADTKGDAHQEK